MTFFAKKFQNIPARFPPPLPPFNKNVPSLDKSVNDWFREKVVDFASFQNSVSHRGNIRILRETELLVSLETSQCLLLSCKNVSLFRAAFDFHVAKLDDRIEMVIPSSGWQ